MFQFLYLSSLHESDLIFLVHYSVAEFRLALPASSESVGTCTNKIG